MDASLTLMGSPFLDVSKIQTWERARVMPTYNDLS